MKFATHAVTPKKEILYNDHYVAIPFDCSAVDANEKGIIPAGTPIAHDNEYFGILLSDVVKEDNPNGTVVIHGFIKADKLPMNIGEETVKALAGRITVINPDGTIYRGTVSPQ